jgi:hypothetical protein
VYRHRFTLAMLWAIAATLVISNNAMAYIGPGAGMEFIGYAISLAAMVGVAFLSFLMWPFYTFMRWVRGTRKTSGSAEQSLVASTPISNASPPAQPIAPSDNGPAVPSSRPAP